MKTKIVYTLISSDKDFFTEQTLISMYSLKMHNPDAHIALLIDNATFASFIGKRERIKEYVNEFIIVKVPEEFNAKERSRFIKTSIRQNISGDYLYIDNDTIIRDSLSEIDDFQFDLGAVLDYHAKLDERKPHMKSNIELYLKKTKKEFWGSNYYFNSGVMYVKDKEITHKFYEAWHKMWNIDRIHYNLYMDQAVLAQINVKMCNVITELSGIYNCQFLIPTSAPYFLKPKIIHYLCTAARAFILNSDSVLKEVKEKGITEKIKYIIKNPQETLLENSHIISEADFNLMMSPMGLLGRKLSRDYKWSNRVARFIYRLFGLKLD